MGVCTETLGILLNCLLQYKRQKNTTVPQTQLLYLTASNVLNKGRLLKAVQYLSLINLIKPATVYMPAHRWHNLTAVSRVPWNEQSSAVTFSRYSSQNSRRSDNNNYSYYYIDESLYIFKKCSGTFQKLT